MRVARRAGRPLRHAGGASVLFCALAALAGCGGVSAADLFVVTRTSSAGHRLTLLVNEEGGLNCNGGPTLKVSDAQLVLARGIQEELHDPATRNQHFPARPGSVYTYSVREEAGTVTFADNASGQPTALRQLALWVLQVSQQVCHLPD